MSSVIAKLPTSQIGDWKSGPDLPTGRTDFAAVTTLANGRVLLAGGSSTAAAGRSAMGFDPSTGQSAATGCCRGCSRQGGTQAVALLDGRALSGRLLAEHRPRWLLKRRSCLHGVKMLLDVIDKEERVA